MKRMRKNQHQSSIAAVNSRTSGVAAVAGSGVVRKTSTNPTTAKCNPAPPTSSRPSTPTTATISKSRIPVSTQLERGRTLEVAVDASPKPNCDRRNPLEAISDTLKHSAKKSFSPEQPPNLNEDPFSRLAESHTKASLAKRTSRRAPSTDGTWRLPSLNRTSPLPLLSSPSTPNKRSSLFPSRVSSPVDDDDEGRRATVKPTASRNRKGSVSSFWRSATSGTASSSSSPSTPVSNFVASAAVNPETVLSPPPPYSPAQSPELSSVRRHAAARIVVTETIVEGDEDGEPAPSRPNQRSLLFSSLSSSGQSRIPIPPVPTTFAISPRTATPPISRDIPFFSSTPRSTPPHESPLSASLHAHPPLRTSNSTTSLTSTLASLVRTPITAALDLVSHARDRDDDEDNFEDDRLDDDEEDEDVERATQAWLDKLHSTSSIVTAQAFAALTSAPLPEEIDRLFHGVETEAKPTAFSEQIEATNIPVVPAIPQEPLVESQVRNALARGDAIFERNEIEMLRLENADLRHTLAQFASEHERLHGELELRAMEQSHQDKEARQKIEAAAKIVLAVRCVSDENNVICRQRSRSSASSSVSSSSSSKSASWWTFLQFASSSSKSRERSTGKQMGGNVTKGMLLP
ncbi:hypothetical protein BJ742DRAFT_849967 [Cladochytrium replicatum]|nr:hypothetical protein BJ742DRAFT_849967 [Cladochytrium replicatum]